MNVYGRVEAFGSCGTENKRKPSSNLSFVQILEVRMQCVVVDVHTDQPLQKKKKQVKSQM